MFRGDGQPLMTVSHTKRIIPMSDSDTSEKIEIARYHREIVEDFQHMLKKYVRIMEWDVPDVDEQEARSLVMQALKSALAEVEAG
jgi:hypothetical protein